MIAAGCTLQLCSNANDTVLLKGSWGHHQAAGIVVVHDARISGLLIPTHAVTPKHAWHARVCRLLRPTSRMTLNFSSMVLRATSRSCSMRSCVTEARSTCVRPWLSASRAR
jgi:hypothetical protein